MKKKLIIISILFIIVFSIQLVGCSAKTFKVTFDLDDGNITDYSLVYKVKEGEVINQPLRDPIKEGYVFREWQVNGLKYNFSTPIRENIRILATYDIKECNVTFDLDGGDINQDDLNQRVPWNTIITNPGQPKKEGYTFKEWQVRGEKYDFSNAIKEDTTIKAVYDINKYNVRFELDGGELIGLNLNQMVDWNTTVDNPGFPKKEGHTFKEWQSKGTRFDFATHLKEDTIITATYDINQYNVTYNLDGGELIGLNINQVVDYNTALLSPGIPTKRGYTFIKWQLNGNDFDHSTPIVNESNIKAIYERDVWEAKVSFGIEEGDWTEIKTQTYQGYIDLEINIKPLNGYDLKSAQTIIFDENNKTYKVPLVKNVSKWHDVTIKYFGEDLYGSHNILLDEIVANDAEKNEITIQKKIFSNFSWNSTNIEKYIVTNEISQEVIVKLDRNQYTIKFNGNGHTEGNVANQVVKFDEVVKLNANNFLKENYVFIGWSTTLSGDVEFTNQQEISNLIAEGMMTLYAVWACEVELVLNGGVLPGGSTVAKETIYVKESDFPFILPFPKKTRGDGNLEFLGWYTQNNLSGSKLNVLTTAKKYTLYANWGSLVYYIGEYPQSKVTDTLLISVLDRITPIISSREVQTSRGKLHTEKWYTVIYKGYKFERVGADYFKYEPIINYKLSDGTKYSKYILDYQTYDEYVDSSTATYVYNDSYIKNYLEQVFKEKSAVTTVGLMSKAQLSNSSDFPGLYSAKAESTDYAKAIFNGERGKITAWKVYYNYLNAYWTNSRAWRNSACFYINKLGIELSDDTNVVMGLRLTLS